MQNPLKEILSSYEEGKQKTVKVKTPGEVIKGWANAIRSIALIFMVLSVLAAFIVFVASEVELWFVSLSILGGAGLILLFAGFTAALTWGFGDLVDNTAKIANARTTPVVMTEESEHPEEGEELPEL